MSLPTCGSRCGIGRSRRRRRCRARPHGHNAQMVFGRIPPVAVFVLASQDAQPDSHIYYLYIVKRRWKGHDSPLALSYAGLGVPGPWIGTCQGLPMDGKRQRHSTEWRGGQHRHARWMGRRIYPRQTIVVTHVAYWICSFAAPAFGGPVADKRHVVALGVAEKTGSSAHASSAAKPSTSKMGSSCPTPRAS